MLAIPLVAVMMFASPSAPAAAAIQVTGLPKAGELRTADLEALGAATFTATLDGQEHHLRGISLDAVLKHFGFEPGPMRHDMPVREKRSGWKKALVATARDGFQAVFSCAEVSAGMGPTRAFIVWEVDGKPVAAERGPFRLVVTTDAEPSRSLWQLERLEVVDLRAPAK